MDLIMLIRNHCILSILTGLTGIGQMVQWVNMLTAKPENLSVISEIHVAKEEDSLK